MDISNNGCPTAVLVDVSPPRGFHLNHDYASSNTNCFKDSDDCKFMNIKNKDSEEKLNKIANHAHGCQTEVSHNASNLCEIESQVPLRKIYWKTPSPRSMSCISKEASKVIDHLNSSSIFDDDLLLDEEVFPIPFNLDELDDDADQRDSSDNVLAGAVLGDKSSVCMQSLNKTEENNECHSSPKDTPIIHNNLQQTLPEKNLTEVNFSVSIKSDSISKESCQCVVDSRGNSDSLICSDEADDVFDATLIASEDKENMQNKKKIFVRKEIVRSKISSKVLSVNKSKSYQRGTLKNLSNIEPETSAKLISFTKNVTTPLKRMSISTNTMKFEPSTEKPQMKKTTLSVDSHYSFKKHSLSNSFHFQNTKELISSVKKSQPTIKIDSACSSISSDMKQKSVFATPSKRYSICTPLKSASAIKPPLTPAITSSHTFAFTRYTPQPIRPSRLSFSRSLQPSVGNSQFLVAKGHKQEINLPSSVSKIAPGFKSLSNSRRLSFSQSMSAVPVRSSGTNIMSSSGKGRFSSKLNLPSPLTVQQDKKVVRALFTSVSKK